jgi:hypothetical protein
MRTIYKATRLSPPLFPHISQPVPWLGILNKPFAVPDLRDAVLKCLLPAAPVPMAGQ